MILGFLITSHGTPKDVVLCTVLGNTVQALDNLCKTVHKTPTLEVLCEVIKKPRIIWSLVPCSGGLSLQHLLVTHLNVRHSMLRENALHRYDFCSTIYSMK